MSAIRLSDLADELGIHKSTVARALRGDPQIARKTKVRILRLAETRGYVRDPSLSALAESRWRGKSSRRPNWGFLISENALRFERNQIFCETMKQYARQAGYVLDILVLRAETTAKELNRLIRARGLQGLLVNAIYYQQSVARLDFSKLSYERASWVFCGEFFFEPFGHRVVENYFNNTLIALQRMVAAGYRKIALVYQPLILNAHGPIRQRAAALEFSRAHPELDIRLVELNEAVSPPEIEAALEGADALLLARTYLRHMLAPRFRALPYASLYLEFNQTHHSGIRDASESLILSAIDMLDFECRRYSRGIPAHRHTLTVESEWLDGDSL